MAYVDNTALHPVIITNNGNETIDFIQTTCTFKEEDVSYATPYFNPVTGQYDTTKSTLYFESGESLVIDQTFGATSTQLIALN
tara:strand:- start:834 stop:1082 length:249 start_codon:yes stop_codon:yes gene_type:complete